MISMDFFKKGSSSKKKSPVEDTSAIASSSKSLSLKSSNDDDFTFQSSAGTPEDEKIDTIVGVLEDILVDEAFTDLQNSFFDQYCDQFTHDEENKLCYMDIFQAYTLTVEGFLDKKLKAALPWFSMSEFLLLLKDRADQAQEGEVFELLASLGDFTLFKEMILDYKDSKEGKVVDLSGLLEITPSKK